MNHLVAAWVFSGLLGYWYWPWRYAGRLEHGDKVSLACEAWFEIPISMLSGPFAFILMMPM